jgi:hypothetical protein
MGRPALCSRIPWGIFIASVIVISGYGREGPLGINLYLPITIVCHIIQVYILFVKYLCIFVMYHVYCGITPMRGAQPLSKFYPLPFNNSQGKGDRGIGHYIIIM